MRPLADDTEYRYQRDGGSTGTGCRVNGAGSSLTDRAADEEALHATWEGEWEASCPRTAALAWPRQSRLGTCSLLVLSDDG